ncbi:TVP38/TMEM64 family protein [Paenibacillus tarimensis]
MSRKIGMAVFYTGVGCLVYAYGEAILAWLQTSGNVLLVTGAAVVMALFPVIPYPVVGGVIGAAWGPVSGGIVTWTGSTAASLLMFLFFRYGYQTWGIRLLHERKGIGRATELFEQNAFLAILFARLIPIIPSIVVNIYSAVSRVPFTTYAIASALGKIPAMLLFALVGDNMMTAPENIVLTIGTYALFLLVTLLGYSRWKRKQSV